MQKWTLRKWTLHMQLWRHDQGTYDVIETRHLFPMRSTCCVPSFNFFLGVVSEIRRSKVFSIFPTWLPHHVTCDVINIIKTFYMGSDTNAENFVSIRQAVVDKNTKVLCGQTDRDRQTDRSKQTGKQMDPNAITSPLARVIKVSYVGCNSPGSFFP